MCASSSIGLSECRHGVAYLAFDFASVFATTFTHRRAGSAPTLSNRIRYGCGVAVASADTSM